MSRCDAELCQYWTGQGCICEAMGIEPDEEVRHCAECGQTITVPAGSTSDHDRYCLLHCPLE